MTNVKITVDVVNEVVTWMMGVSNKPVLLPDIFVATAEDSSDYWFLNPAHIKRLRESRQYGADGRDLMWAAVAFYGEAGLEYAAQAGLGLDALPDRIAELIDQVTTRGRQHANAKPRARVRQFAADGERAGRRAFLSRRRLSAVA